MGLLDGKTAIVSGAALGLGRAFALRLAHEGANVVAFDIKPSIAAVGDELKTAGAGVVASVADISSRSACERLVGDAVSAFGGVDILVNNAGKWTQSPVTDPWEKAVADFDEIMDTNLKGVMMLSRLCVPHMVARGGGDILNVSTYYVLPARSEGTNPPGTDLYAASKWGLNGFTQSWAAVLKKDNIRVNAICPGAVDTPMLRGLWPAPQEPPADFVKTWMRPEEIAQLMMDLFADGRSGENIGAWAGYPVALPPRARPDSLQRMRPDFTGRPGAIYPVPPWDDLLEPVSVNMGGPVR